MIASRAKKTKRPEADRRWTLLFIGDHGDVITLKRFKTIVIATVFIFLSAICAMAILFFMNHGTIAKNKELQFVVEKSQNQIEDLRHENEVLMARLVIAESKAKKNSAGTDGPSRPAINPAEQIAQKPQPVPKEAAEKVEQKIPAVPEIVASKPLAAEKDEPGPVLSVAVENFSVSREPDSENLNVQFKIKNTGPESQPVSGHTVLVLKGEDLAIDQWLVMPAVAMAGEVPAGKHGKTFSIHRFRAMSFSFKSPDNFDAFQTAVVYVFLKSGELLLEEDFPITLPAPPVPARQAPSSQAPSATNLPAETPSAETHTYDDSSSHKFY